MTETNFLITNCSAADFEYACPKLWNELRPSITAAIRHRDHCSRNVYLCRTDADIKLYRSVNYCIDIAETGTRAENELETPRQPEISSVDSVSNPEQQVRIVGVMRAEKRDGRPELSNSENEMYIYDIPDFLRKRSPGPEK